MQKRTAIITGILVSVLAIALIAWGLLVKLQPSTGRFDTEAARNIQKLCGERSDCQVRLRDLSSRKWTTYYEFDQSISDADISKVIGVPFHANHDLSRIIILMNNGKVDFSESTDQGVEMPLPGEVWINCKPFEAPFTACDSNALLKVMAIEKSTDHARLFAASGTAYNLTQLN
jgi:hypothetical protein